MENDFYLSGIIKGKNENIKKNDPPKAGKPINFLSTIEKIKQELKKKYENSINIYVYTRFSNKTKIFNIYVTFFSDSKYNDKTFDISFLISLNSSYPNKPPLVYCLTVFNPDFDIFDMRNIQEDLIPNWSINNNINDLIIKIPELIKNVEFQIECDLYPLVGKYIINEYEYDINDFLLNSNNKFYKILIPDNEDSEKVKKFQEKYIIITKSNILVFNSVNKNYKNMCVIEHVIKLISIERVRRFLYDQENFNNLSCFKFVYNKNSKYHTFNSTMCADQNTLVSKAIYELINKRKEELFDNFKIFENSDSNNVKQIEQIISIKEKIIQRGINENIFNQIQKFYNQIIENISSTHNDNDKELQYYIQKLKKFLKSYDEINQNENKKDNKENRH